MRVNVVDLMPEAVFFNVMGNMWLEAKAVIYDDEKDVYQGALVKIPVNKSCETESLEDGSFSVTVPLHEIAKTPFPIDFEFFVSDVRLYGYQI